VDAVLGEHELVTRPVPEELGTAGAFLGVATLGFGQLLVVLSPSWLLRERDRPDAGFAGRLALVVDDSITARAMYRAVLESAGFVVHVAASAEQALAHLFRSSYEVVVSDIVLGEHDGLWLTRTVRQKPEIRATPVILVSTQDGDEDMARAYAAGADAFVPKKDCATGSLLREVSVVMSRKRGAA
jgi:CheY-like chemotaxis protein